jgi:muramoyltetrapeptide carboxypeptidase LdcA involved in peptidoglycan recycling
MKIIYPNNPKVHQPLKIAITAPSSGLGPSPKFHQRFQCVAEDFRRHGHQLHFGSCLLADHKHVSGSATAPAADFLEMWLDDSIHLILPPWGGEFLINMLPHIPFAELPEAPTWVQGFSENRFYSGASDRI